MLVLAVEQHLSGIVKFPVYGHQTRLLLMGKSMQICKNLSSIQTCGRNRFVTCLTTFWLMPVVAVPASWSLLTCRGRARSRGWCGAGEEGSRLEGAARTAGGAVPAAALQSTLLHLPSAYRKALLV